MLLLFVYLFVCCCCSFFFFFFKGGVCLFYVSVIVLFAHESQPSSKLARRYQLLAVSLPIDIYIDIVCNELTNKDCAHMRVK